MSYKDYLKENQIEEAVISADDIMLPFKAIGKIPGAIKDIQGFFKNIKASIDTIINKKKYGSNKFFVFSDMDTFKNNLPIKLNSNPQRIDSFGSSTLWSEQNIRNLKSDVIDPIFPRIDPGNYLKDRNPNSYHYQFGIHNEWSIFVNTPIIINKDFNNYILKLKCRFHFDGKLFYKCANKKVRTAINKFKIPDFKTGKHFDGEILFHLNGNQLVANIKMEQIPDIINVALESGDKSVMGIKQIFDLDSVFVALSYIRNVYGGTTSNNPSPSKTNYKGNLWSFDFDSISTETQVLNFAKADSKGIDDEAKEQFDSTGWFGVVKGRTTCDTSQLKNTILNYINVSNELIKPKSDEATKKQDDYIKKMMQRIKIKDFDKVSQSLGLGTSEVHPSWNFEAIIYLTPSTRQTCIYFNFASQAPQVLTDFEKFRTEKLNMMRGLFGDESTRIIMGVLISKIVQSFRDDSNLAFGKYFNTFRG